MGELLLLIIIGAVVIALGLWIFSNFAVVAGIALVVGVAAFGIAILKWAMSGVSKYIENNSLPRATPTVIPRAEGHLPEALTVLEATHEAIAVVQRSIRAEVAAASTVTQEAEQVLAQVEDRKQFVKDNKIDALLCDLLSTMWHYPSWSKRDDADRWVKAPVTFIEMPIEEANRPKHNISFIFEGHTFHLALREWPNYTGDSGNWGDLTLTDGDSNILAAVNVSRSDRAEYNHWRPATVTAFKPGEWVPLLFALQGRMNVAKRTEKVEAETGEAQLNELRASFDL